MADDDVETQMKDEISPEADVYSYSTMAAMEQRKKYGKFTVDAFLSYFLVLLVLIIQGVLLWCVYNKVVVNNVRWVGSIMQTDQDWAVFAPPGDGCNTGSSLCTIQNGTYSCAPPSVQLIGRWDELDSDGNGIWTRDEVLAQRQKLKCKYVVDPVEIFDVFINMLKQREKLIWLHPDVKQGKAIHKPYFTYVMGDIAMCGYRNQDMCANLLKRGVFHAALKYQTAPRVGDSVESALDYCRQMLEPRGYCERFLPSTYATWKIKSVVQCQDPKYKSFVYENPGNGVTKSLLEVDYKARQRYETAQTAIFMTYKAMICGVWILLIISQLRGVCRVFNWVLTFPSSQEDDNLPNSPVSQSSARAAHHESAEDFKVEGITGPHRIVMGIVTLMRIIMLCILMYVGMSFLGKQTDYIGLLLDGVALIFVIEVQEIVYEKIIRADVRGAWEDSEPLEVNKGGIPYLSRNPDVVDLIWLCVIILSSYLFITIYTNDLVTPLHDSLQCACTGEGDHCYEATRFSKTFWDQYWRYDVPGVFDDVKNLKEGMWQSLAAAPSPGPAPSPASVNLLQHARLLQNKMHQSATYGLGQLWPVTQ